ncbi:MAG: dihydrolipoyl dehydrogenase [Rhodobacterales bacterium]|nr:dihydrolipoyl dehydrogenase [Rhodobacterales bacterium]
MAQSSLVVVGGGVGGYASALRAARRGAAVTLIEKDRIGGVCLNKGCIPTKVLLHASALLHDMKKAPLFGVSAGAVSFDHAAILARKSAIVGKLTGGVAALLRASKIKVIDGTAAFTDPHTLKIRETGETVTADKIIIATGSLPARLTLPGSDAVPLLTSDDLLDLDSLPESLVLIGGGYIGVELGQFFSRVGVKVTIVEMRDTLVPTEDAEMGQALAKALRAEGIEILTGAAVEKVAPAKGGATVFVRTATGRTEIAASAVAQTVGRVPSFEGLDIQKIGLRTEKGAIQVSARMQTSVPHIYAVGDVTGGILLAHVAMAEAECAVENALAGDGEEMSYHAVPRCIYTAPEIGCVGLTEAQAAARGEVKVARFPLHAVGKALLMDEQDGMIKIVADRKDGEILGVHIVGPHATELVTEAVLAIGLECTVEELARTIHPHPTVSEGVGEAAMMLAGGALHLP